ASFAICARLARWKPIRSSVAMAAWMIWARRAPAMNVSSSFGLRVSMDRTSVGSWETPRRDFKHSFKNLNGCSNFTMDGLAFASDGGSGSLAPKRITTKVHLFFLENGLFGKINALCTFRMEK